MGMLTGTGFFAPNPYNTRFIFQARYCRGRKIGLKQMVKIRLARAGAKKRPFYHVVVTDERNARDGRYIERLGSYNPIPQGKERELDLDVARADQWVAKGAQLTDRTRALLKAARKLATA